MYGIILEPHKDRSTDYHDPMQISLEKRGRPPLRGGARVNSSRRSRDPLVLGPRSKIQHHHHQKIRIHHETAPGKFLKSRPKCCRPTYVSRTAVPKRSAQHSRCLRAGSQPFHRKMRIQFTTLTGAEYNSQITRRTSPKLRVESATA